MDVNTPLPDALRPYFWDYPSTELSLETDQSLVSRRILTDGSWEAIQWLRSRLGDRALKQWLIAHRGRGLSPSQLRFWGLVLDLPVRQLDTWVQAASETPWGRR